MIPPGVIQRANFVLDRDDILDVSNSVQILKANLSTVQLAITKVQKDLDDQLQAIALTRQRLEEAKANEESIVEAISRGEALLAPSAIRKLPAEILSEIFLHFLNLCFAETSLRRPTILKAQTLLRVCRRWHQTMMSDPRLWQTIPVGYFNGYFEGYGRHDHPPLTAEQWEKLEERIARARGAQDLRILVMIDVKDNISQSRIIRTVSDLLPRAKTFQMDANYRPIDGETLPRPVDTLSNLKEVVLGSMHKSYGTWIHNILTRATDLRALECDSLSPQFIPRSCLGKLRCLRLNGCVESGEVFRAMVDAALLAELYIKDSEHTQGQTPAKIVIRHEQLETLHVDNAKFDLLESLSLPSLRHLSFGRGLGRVRSDCGKSHLSIVFWPSDTRFFERSNCKLVSLEVVDVDISPDLVDILQSQECLETLYFRSKFTDSIPRAVLVFLEANLPFLRRLRIYVEPSEIPAVQRMLAKRTKRDDFVALESCSIVLARGYGTETMKESHRGILGPFLEGSKSVQLVYQ